MAVAVVVSACVGSLSSAPGATDALSGSGATAGTTPAPVTAADPPTGAPTATARTSATSCVPTDQDRYVYHPYRLTVRATCLRVSGVVDAVRQEADGDLHMLLRLDAPYAKYLTPANQGEELGDLVVEPVCVHPVTQSDAVQACAGDTDPLQNLPHTGMRVWMEGRYVLDTEHGSWAELHPLYRWGTGTTVSGTAGKVASSPAPSPMAGGSAGSLRVALVDVPSPATIGASATVGARTSAGASCSVRVTLPSGRVSTVAALGMAETADGAGNVSWTWTIRSNTSPGTASVTVSCSLGARSGSATASFEMR